MPFENFRKNNVFGNSFHLIRDRPFMIWGRGVEEESKMGFIFSAGMPFENFPGEGLLRFIFFLLKGHIKKNCY